MKLVFKLISGEEIIGTLACETDEDFDKLEQFELMDPMWIVPSEGGAMKLRDACMLSENDGLIFVPECIITCYKPSINLINYYLQACEYSKTFTRAGIGAQIDLATIELEQMMHEEKREEAKMGELYRKLTGSKLH
jgi:glutaredoxin